MAGLRVEEAPPAPIKHSFNLSIVKISHAWEEKKRSLETSWDVMRHVAAEVMETVAVKA